MTWTFHLSETKSSALRKVEIPIIPVLVEGVRRIRARVTKIFELCGEDGKIHPEFNTTLIDTFSDFGQKFNGVRDHFYLTQIIRP